MSEIEQKKAFAAALLKSPDDPFKAALDAFPEQTSFALRVAQTWPNDAEVKKLLQELRDSGADLEALPTKADWLREIWDKARNTVDPDDFQKLMKLYGDGRGFIEKPQTNINAQTAVVNSGVMIVPNHGSDADWEKKLAAQQEKLIADGNASIAATKH